MRELLDEQVDSTEMLEHRCAHRNIARGAFEPVTDGSGVLRLIEPAVAEWCEDRWRLVQPGQLGGFTY